MHHLRGERRIRRRSVENVIAELKQAKVEFSPKYILILDDSTSNVDAQTEAQIRKAIDSLLQGRTALIITQRASTCEAADKVVLMENGRIIAMGSHRDLLESSSGYRRLIESQELDIVSGGEASG